MSNRTAYNRLQAETRRQQSEILRRFKEANPEVYERLLKKAQEEIEAESRMAPLELLNLKRPVIRHTLPQTSPYNPSEHHYLIHTKDEWNTPHLSTSRASFQLLQPKKFSTSFTAVIRNSQAR